jgi:glycosyltransferase involved in cell wall biosynthesis
LSVTRDMESLVIDERRRTQPNPPLVSVVICVYNAGKYFRPALSSILNQTYANLEILVIDDGSTDGCVEFAEDLLADSRVRLFRQTNATKPVALNRALDQVRGEFYAIHDADDISHPRRIEIQVQVMLARPHLAAVFCGNELIIDGKSMAPTFAPKSEAECRQAIDAYGMPAHDPTGMYRMSLVGDVRYDEALPSVEGVDYTIRVGERHPMFVIGECLYGYRILRSSVTRRDPARTRRLVVKALSKACERRGLDYAQVFPGGPFGYGRSRQSLEDNNIAACFITSVLDQRRVRGRLGSLRTGIQCVRLQPLDFHYYKALIYALLPLQAISLLKRKAWRRRD